MERRDDPNMKPNGQAEAPAVDDREEAAESGGADAPGAEVRAELSALGAALEEARAEYAQLTDRHLRLAAEYDNYRKRTERERLELYGRAQADLAARLLDAVDDLERVATYDAAGPAGSLLQGVQLVDRKLRTALEAAGLATVDAEGAVFDPTTMEGLATVPAERPEDDDVVSDVFQRGYTFKGQLIRPARVRVKKFEG